jgi:hypothetical protein
MPQIINATGSDITITGWDGTPIVYPKTEHVAKLRLEGTKPNGHWLRDNLICIDYAIYNIYGIPKPDDMGNIYYIVSPEIAMVACNRQFEGYDLICVAEGNTGFNRFSITGA